MQYYKSTVSQLEKKRKKTSLVRLIKRKKNEEKKNPKNIRNDEGHMTRASVEDNPHVSCFQAVFSMSTEANAVQNGHCNNIRCCCRC